MDFALKLMTRAKVAGYMLTGRKTRLIARGVAK